MAFVGSPVPAVSSEGPNEATGLCYVLTMTGAQPVAPLPIPVDLVQGIGFAMAIDGLFSDTGSIFPPPDEWSGNSLSELEAVVYLSIFSNRRVAAHELPPEQFDQQGFWGDTPALALDEGDVWGSRIWLLYRAKVTTDPPQTQIQRTGVTTPEQAAQFLDECLAWLKADGVVTDIEIVTARTFDRAGRVNGIAAEITLVRERSKDPIVIRFDPLWEAFRNG